MSLLNLVTLGIEKRYGIVLTWSEQAALRHYLGCFRNKQKINGERIIVEAEAVHWFMQDYFGLDDIDLGSIPVPMNSGDRRITGRYGFNFLGDERFKRYCKDNVQMWREERSIPSRR